MQTRRIGIQLASLRMPFKKALETAARLGAAAVEIDARGEVRPRDFTGTAQRQLRKMLDDLRLKVCAVGFRTRRGYNVVDDLDRRISATKEAMDFAYALGANVVINHVGSIPEEPTGPHWDQLVDSLTELGKYGQRCGAVLAAETGSESGPSLRKLIDALPDGSLAVNFDPGNLVVNAFPVDEALAALAGRIAHVHAKDGVRDLAQGRGLEVPLGRGTADFPALLGALEEQGYRGFFTIEREKCNQPLEEISAAVEYLRQLLI